MSTPRADIKTSKGRPLQVLMVEDNDDDLALVLNALRKGGFDPQYFRVMEAAALRDALQAKTWDIVLSDFQMPAFSGLAALRLVREMGLDLPFIIVSGTIDDISAVQCMKAGAHDYLMKDNLVRLCAAVERELKEAEERSSRRKAEAQLFGFEKMASLGTLAAGVAHEINSPLAYSLMNLELSLESLNASEAASPELKAMLKSSEEGMLRVKEIVSELKTFSRTRESANGPVDLAATMDSALKLVNHELRHGATVVKDYGLAQPVEANQGRLGQVFMNLLINAAHAIEPGHSSKNKVTLRIRQLDAQWVEAEVIDTGKGISPENLKKIFEPFFTTKTQGTGLGLPLCQKLVSEMGGDIAVSSKLGEGTCVRVHLPVSQSAVYEKEEILAPQQPVFKRGRILVLDDEQALAEVIQKYLGRWHDVTVLHDGEKGLELLTKDSNFDLVLSDLMMPELTGAELYVKLSRLNPGYEKKIAFITGGGFGGESMDFLNSVPNLRIEKPFQLRSLFDMVEAMLKLS